MAPPRSHSEQVGLWCRPRAIGSVSACLFHYTCADTGPLLDGRMERSWSWGFGLLDPVSQDLLQLRLAGASWVAGGNLSYQHILSLLRSGVLLGRSLYLSKPISSSARKKILNKHF